MIDNICLLIQIKSQGLYCRDSFVTSEVGTSCNL